MRESHANRYHVLRGAYAKTARTASPLQSVCTHTLLRPCCETNEDDITQMEPPREGAAVAVFHFGNESIHTCVVGGDDANEYWLSAKIGVELSKTIDLASM